MNKHIVCPGWSELRPACVCLQGGRRTMSRVVRALLLARASGRGITFAIQGANTHLEICSCIHEVTPLAPTKPKTRGSRLGSLY
jgi:hypothetical protein